MFTLLIFLVVIAVLVLTHEFGHFIVAKWKGMRVDEFGFGFPPRVYGKQIGETLYSINLLPFGGFVRVWGEDDSSAVEASEGAAAGNGNFATYSAWDRFLVLVAGVGMNFLTAYTIFSIGMGFGMQLPAELIGSSLPSEFMQKTVRIAGVMPDSPAANAGFMTGDAVAYVRTPEETVSIASIEELQNSIVSRGGVELSVGIIRNGAPRELAVVPVADTVEEHRAAIGVALGEELFVNVPFWRAPWYGAQVTAIGAFETFRGLGRVFVDLFSGATQEVRDNVVGPVGIAVIAGETARAGFSSMMLLIAVLSLALGVLNLLPIPALDGGRIFFLLLEKLRGVPFHVRTTQLAHTIGFVTLLFLMLLITYFDVTRFF